MSMYKEAEGDNSALIMTATSAINESEIDKVAKNMAIKEVEDKIVDWTKNEKEKAQAKEPF